MKPDGWQVEEYLTWHITNSSMMKEVFLYIYLRPINQLMKVTQEFLREKEARKKKAKQ